MRHILVASVLVVLFVVASCGPVNTTINLYKAEDELAKAKRAGFDKTEFLSFFNEWCSKPQFGIAEETWREICKVRQTCVTPLGEDNYYCRKAKDIYFAETCKLRSTYRRFCYYYFKSLEYYNKAKEEEGYAEFEHAIAFAKEAQALARKAFQTAEQEEEQKRMQKELKRQKKTKKQKIRRSSEEDILEEDEK